MLLLSAVTDLFSVLGIIFFPPLIALDPVIHDVTLLNKTRMDLKWNYLSPNPFSATAIATEQTTPTSKTRKMPPTFIRPSSFTEDPESSS